MGAKSGKGGQRKRPGAAKASAPKSVSRNRLWLIVFGALFIGLFVIFAVAQGLGQPSVPAGDIAIVEEGPEGTEHLSEEEFERALEQFAGQSELKKVPKPGTKKYEELKETAISEVINSVWLRGEAEDLDISVTPKQVEEKLAEIKKSNFPTPAAFKEFLETAHYTPAEVNERVELQLLTEKIQSTVANEVPPPTKSEISDYYNAAKASKYTVKPTRDVRLVVNKDKSKVEGAQAELEKDNSPANWKKVASKYSSDPTTKTQGGLQKEIPEELLQEPLKKDLFGAATGEIIGPIAYQGNFFIFEVVKLNPEKVKTLAEVEQEISSTLSQEAQQKHLAEFVLSYESKWKARTFCASDFLIERCSNFKGSGHPSSAPAACYEANPKTPTNECPAPVEMIKPALPGTTTLLKPEGERLVQRPRPEGKAAGVQESKLGGGEAEAGEGAGAEAE